MARECDACSKFKDDQGPSIRFDSIRFGSIRFDSVRFGSMQLHCVSEEHLRSIRKTNPLSLADPKLFYFVISKTAMSSSILKPFHPFVLFSKTNTCFSPIIIFLNSRRVPLIQHFTLNIRNNENPNF